MHRLLSGRSMLAMPLLQVLAVILVALALAELFYWVKEKKAGLDVYPSAPVASTISALAFVSNITINNQQSFYSPSAE